jgi:hypothetical protein
MNYKTGLLIVLMGSLLLASYIPTTQAFYNTDWTRARRISVQSADVSSDLTDFPVLVYLDSSRINWTETQDDLDDLRFVDEDNSTFLYYEIENYTVNDEAWVWVNLPFVNSSSDTEFYMYWGNTGATSGESMEDVWDSDYISVYHLNDLTNSTIEDSTINSNDLSKKGADEPNITSLRIDGAQLFDGSDDYMSSDSAFTLADTLTFEYWLNSSADGTAKSLWSDNAQWHTQGYIWMGRNPGATSFYYEYANTTHTQSWTSLNYFLDDTMFYFTLVVNYTSDTIEIFRNGVSYDSGSIPNAITVNGLSRTQFIGSFSSGNHFWNNTFDEIRVSDINRSSSYIGASYESGRDRLLTYGSRVEVYPPLTNPCATIHPNNPENVIEQVFFGDGRALGLGLMLLLCGIITMKSPGFGGIMLIPLFLLGYQYYARAQCVPELFWYFIGSLSGMVINALMIFSKR